MGVPSVSEKGSWPSVLPAPGLPQEAVRTQVPAWYFLKNPMKISISYPERTPDAKKLLRSEATQEIVTDTQIKNGMFPGGNLRIATHLSLTEWILWKLGLLK